MAKDGRLAAAAATWHQEPPMERPPHARVDEGVEADPTGDEPLGSFTIRPTA